MLLVDDAHLLDSHSAALVLQLALAMPSFVVATIRTGQPVPDPVVALWKEGLAERVEVGPLDDRSIEEIAARVLEGPADVQLTRTVAGRADGNPLVARELCLAGLDSGAIEKQDGLWTLVGDLGVSARVVELVEARVTGLGDAEHQALDVVGQAEPLGLHMAQKLVSSEALIGLERRALVVLREDGRRRDLWLSHPFYADVVRATAGPLHAVVAAVLRGKPRTAQGILDRAGPLPSDPLASSADALTALIAALTGQADEAARALAGAEESMRRESRTANPLIDQARVWTLVARRQPRDARRVAMGAIDHSLEAHCWSTALDLVHDLTRIGGLAEAISGLDRIGDRVDGPLAAARRLHVEGLSRGDADRLENASRAFGVLGADLLAAEAAADAGRAARRRGEARRSTRLLQRAATLASACEGARTPALLMPEELTPLTSREREIAGLAATGLTSEAIAEQLFVSVRTVDNHMQHVYQKLGITSRRELSAAMSREP
jgi:DNA-binding CsgD family transcriptional regulator